MQLKQLILVFLISCVLTTVYGQQNNLDECCEGYCYSLDDEKPQISHFTLNTPYKLVKGSDSTEQYEIENCTPVKIWLLTRHGLKYPTLKENNAYKELEILRDAIIASNENKNIKPNKGAICDEDIALIKNWTLMANFNYNDLAPQGWNDIKNIATYYKRILPILFENTYDPVKFHFRHTVTQRTKASYESFVEELFGANALEDIQLPPLLKRDILLTPILHCNDWMNTIYHHNYAELKKFRQSEIYQEMLVNVSQRLGLNFTIKSKQIKLMWDLCQLEHSWITDRPSAWCTAFTQSQVTIMEYADDLYYYILAGPGLDINKKLTCAAAADMVHHLESEELPKVITYFTHSLYIALLLTTIGAINDYKPLLADDFEDNFNRKFKSSEVCPLAANVAAIKYDCPNDNERHKIMFMLNQKRLDIDWCQDGFCSWSDVKRELSYFFTVDCERAFCNTNTSADSKGISMLLLPLPLGYVAIILVIHLILKTM